MAPLARPAGGDQLGEGGIPAPALGRGPGPAPITGAGEAKKQDGWHAGLFRYWRTDAGALHNRKAATNSAPVAGGHTQLPRSSGGEGPKFPVDRFPGVQSAGFRGSG